MAAKPARTVVARTCVSMMPRPAVFSAAMRFRRASFSRLAASKSVNVSCAESAPGHGASRRRKREPAKPVPGTLAAREPEIHGTDMSRLPLHALRLCESSYNQSHGVPCRDQA